MRGQRVQEHFLIRMSVLQGTALRHVLEDVRTLHSDRNDDTFILNDLELEAVDEALDILSEESRVND